MFWFIVTALLAVASNARGDATGASADEARNLASETVASIDNSGVIGHLTELQEAFATNEARIAQLQFKLSQLLAEGRYLPEALKNRINTEWLETIQGSTSNLHGEMARANQAIRGLRAFSSGLSILSASANIAEGIDLFQIAGELETARTTTQQEAEQQQALVDQILEQNAGILAAGPVAFVTAFVFDSGIACLPPSSATLRDCSAFAFAQFARVFLNSGLQDASIKNMLLTSEQTISSGLVSYAECGRKHAQSGKNPQFAGTHTDKADDPRCDNLAQRGIIAIESLERSTEAALTLIENRSFGRSLRRGQLAELRDAAALLKSDLANGEHSGVMGEWRAAYFDAYFATAWVLELEKLGDQQQESLRQSKKIAQQIETLQRQAEALHAAVVAANEALAADLAADEPEPEPEPAPANVRAAVDRVVSEDVREWMPPACRSIVDDDWPRESPDALPDHVQRLLQLSWRLPLEDARAVTDQELRAMAVDEVTSRTFTTLQQAALTALAEIEHQTLGLIDFAQQRHEVHIAYLNTQFGDVPVDGEARAQLPAAQAAIHAVLARSRVLTTRSRDYHRMELASIQPRNAHQIREFGYQILVSESWLRQFASQQQSCHVAIHRALVDTYNVLGRSWSESLAKRADVSDKEQTRLARVQNDQYRGFLRNAQKIPNTSPRPGSRWPASSSEWTWPTHKSLVYSLSDLLYLMSERAFLPDSEDCAAYRPTITEFIRSLSPDPGFDWLVARTQLGARVRICIQTGSE
ncbi:MAG: hypothetical protein WD397_16180 [Wenzhouxiangellaceae bacterium]